MCQCLQTQWTECADTRTLSADTDTLNTLAHLQTHWIECASVCRHLLTRHAQGTVQCTHGTVPHGTVQCTQGSLDTLKALCLECQGTVQHTATHCNTLQHTATHCNSTVTLYSVTEYGDTDEVTLYSVTLPTCLEHCTVSP